MEKLRFIVSLITNENEYQREQAATASQTAQRLGLDIQLLYAGNDGINQSQQLLNIIQSSRGPRPTGILCHPAGTTMAQVAGTAVARGIGWAMLNRDPDYLPELRKKNDVPAFAVTVDQEEVGRIQGRQIRALLPGGGLVLYLQGPAISSAVQGRTAGMHATKPDTVQVRTLRGKWTEASAYEAVQSWLRLSTAHDTEVSLVAAQNDNMALGARKAFEENTKDAERERWASVPFTGCDACPGKGQEWVRRGLITASIAIPPTTGLALEMFVRHLQAGTQPPERTVLAPVSYPPLEKLTPRLTGKTTAG
jgi:ribose transport system substrate-binding protein